MCTQYNVVAGQGGVMFCWIMHHMNFNMYSTVLICKVTTAVKHSEVKSAISPSEILLLYSETTKSHIKCQYLKVNVLSCFPPVSYLLLKLGMRMVFKLKLLKAMFVVVVFFIPANINPLIRVFRHR